MGKQRRNFRQNAEKRGRHGELLAALFLRCKGYRILGRRVRTHAGEIDLVAQNLAGVVCFVEVKARPEDDLAAGAVGLRQRARIVRAAGLFLARRPAPKGVRFDVVTVVPGRLPRHRRDAWRPDSL
ncbi:MAG: YraN family protein [Alphaproteobacteria bacterium]|nr:YraN family protein [Alphaproteobacteria bacterium]MDE2109614.1 YraN family protein [Alphaproteobacteria bacterium]MDE2493034.1 YraN family protein [Alphaproteobacteria bacterium]